MSGFLFAAGAALSIGLFIAFCTRSERTDARNIRLARRDLANGVPRDQVAEHLANCGTDPARLTEGRGHGRLA